MSGMAEPTVARKRTTMLPMKLHSPVNKAIIPHTTPHNAPKLVCALKSAIIIFLSANQVAENSIYPVYMFLFFRYSIASVCSIFAYHKSMPNGPRDILIEA